ncbi:MAG: thioesterase family protein [bacterium]|nr:thioesterase family protein [bacterium]
MDYKVTTTVRVRFADLDAMGHVNHAKFFTYMEQARVAYFKKIPELDFMAHTGNPSESVILASIQCDFLAPALLDQILTVGVRISSLGRSRIEMDYEIWKENGRAPVARGKSTLVYFDYQKGKSLPLPDQLIEQFEKIEERKIETA